MDNIKLLGIPFDFGQGHSGVRLAYDTLIEKGMLRRLSSLSGIENLGQLNLPDKLLGEKWVKIEHKEECSLINLAIDGYIRSLDLSSSFLLNVGGDHGMALGTVHSMLRKEPETVVVWDDAHGDINIPESSPSGNFHGMPLALRLGIARGKKFSWIAHQLLPKNLIFFGPRYLDPMEKEIIRFLEIQYFSTQDINRIGSKEIMKMALHRVDPDEIRPIHLSFDVDLFDASNFKSTGIRLPSGPKLEEVFLMGGAVAQTGRLRSMDVVEFNPMLGSREEVDASADLILNFLEVIIGQVLDHQHIELALSLY